MLHASKLDFRMSIVPLKDDVNIDHIVQTMLFTIHDISPIGILFNYDCPHSKSFIAAVCEFKNRFNFKFSINRCSVSVFVDQMLCWAFQVVDFRGEHWLGGDSTATSGFAFRRRWHLLHQFRRCHWVCRQKVPPSYRPNTNKSSFSLNFYISHYCCCCCITASVWENMQFTIFTTMLAHTEADSMSPWIGISCMTWKMEDV